jgi:hypothetical protein
MSTVRPFRFGINVATDPGDLPTREDWIALARKAEDLGYAMFSVADHYINDMPPIAALMYVADATRTLRIGSCVFDVNYRHPILLAKEVAALDWFSGGALSWDWEPDGYRPITSRWVCRSIVLGCAFGAWRSRCLSSSNFSLRTP